MGAWGAGLWSDDLAADIRAAYREALEDGSDDGAAEAKVLDDFAPHLGDEEDSPVVWLALAVAESNLGRLTETAKAHAIDVIDSGADLRRWVGSDPKVIAQRRVVLTRVRAQLVGDQPARKRVRRPARRVTTLQPGDVLGYRAKSGRLHLLAVRALHESRTGTWPVVELLDFADAAPPGDEQMARLRTRSQGRRGAPGCPAEPWWSVSDHVIHRRGHDFTDLGFAVVARLQPLPADEQRRIDATTGGWGQWDWWADYLETQDEALGRRLVASRPSLTCVK